MIDESLDIEDIQIEMLIDAIHRRYDYNFKNYARSSLKRRLRDFIKKESIPDYYQLIDNVLRDRSYFQNFLCQVTVSVTSMFRDPEFYRMFREEVVPVLETYPSFKIWHAGCSTGEEVYSLAILLYEENLLARAKIYATDIDCKSLECAKKGIYPLEKIKLYTQNYNQFVGKGEFADYYYANNNNAAISDMLKKQLIFSEHNLATDGVFSEMNVILCRNVLIYFDKTLQTKVLNLLNKSLNHYGFLCLGMKETLSCTVLANEFEPLNQKTKIYRKMAVQ